MPNFKSLVGEAAVVCRILCLF